MSQNICIYFSDTGGGHRGAADALEGGIRNLVDGAADKPNIAIIKEPVAEKSHALNRFFVEMYNYLLRHHQPLMKYYYNFLHIVKPESGFNYFLTNKYFRKMLTDQKPSVIVSAHPMTHHCTAHYLKEMGLSESVKLLVVVTDPNADLWRAWACPSADLTIVPNAVVKQRLVGWGIEESKIAVVGMPVHPDFVTPPTISRKDFLTHLGLSSDILTVCINAGWAGGGNMLKIYESLSHVERKVQVVFLCGHNTALYEEALAAAAESSIPTAVLPFHDHISDLMHAVDLMVTKAGGLTTYQCVGRRLPMVLDNLTDPMPQERGTIDMLVEQKLAYSLHQADDIIDIVEDFEPKPDRATSSLPKTYEFDLTDGAIFEMAHLVLKNCNPPINLERRKERETPQCDSTQKSMVKETADEI